MHRVEQCIAAHVITSETTNASCCASKTNTHVHADSLHDPLTADALAAGACMSLTSLCNGCENNEHKLNMLAKMLLCILLPQLKKGKFKKGNKMREEDLHGDHSSIAAFSLRRLNKTLGYMDPQDGSR